MSSPLARLPAEIVTTDPDVLESHARDNAPLCAHGTAAALLRPTSTAQVAAVLELASRHAIPVVPQGARSGLAGAANAVDGCWLLSLERMNAVLEVDPVDRIAVVQPGVLNARLSRAVAERGMFYPPDPSSWEFSTLGGNVATNAGGLCCVKYGVTADFVRGLEVVLADGRVLRTGRRTAKGVAGYDLTRLFCGSEGTLGVITEITLALRPAAREPLTAIAFFPGTAAACATVTACMASGVVPSMLELMDRPSMDIVRGYRDLGFPPDADAMLIVQSDSAPPASADLARFAEIARSHGGETVVADDPSESRLLLEARRSVGPATELLGAYLSDDVCVPLGRLVDLVDGVEKIAAEHSVLITCTGHAGDGNMHPTVVFDPRDATQVHRAERAFDAVMELGLALGGTITGEHGIGLLKAAWLEKELGPVSLAVHRDMKALFDPAGILNPGKVVRSRAARP
ncbi:FAD-binding oxidoreductase [Streptomyces shenzhenensis]|uniref:FAD-binding oxidoreductase n=1 Tax=Streptomyces shenzhenensis TaxID=943815 RepID=UPI003D8EECC1